MARLAVNPTRMELRKLKARLKTATRGHKLLKDKSDEMIRRFLEYAYENKRLREEIESELSAALRSFMLAQAVSQKEEVEQAIAMRDYRVDVNVYEENVMGVSVPAMEISKNTDSVTLPYDFASAPAELDEATEKISAFTEKLLKLVEVEKTCNMLADEIEKNRRRVNALEYVMIPQLNETIKYIVMKLDENERGNLTRLMKVKSMITEE